VSARRRFRRQLAVAAVLALTLAACGGDDTDEATEDAATDEAGDDAAAEEPPTDEEGADDAATDAADGAELAVADSDLGDVLVDGEGMTLYLFDPDEQGESTCYDDCATTWPPVEAPVTAGEGVDESLIGETERTDGTSQATYDDWPLYNYAADSAPGDVTGQGVGDVWWVVGPDGARITEVPEG
jgi:predicted lipoprotein with Yx(FWY)xxD motif